MPVVVFPGYKLILVSNIFGDLSYFSIKKHSFYHLGCALFFTKKITNFYFSI